MRQRLTSLLVLGLAALVAADTTVPPEARSNFDKGELAREVGKMREAAPFYKKAIELHPFYWKAHAGYLSALRAIEDFASAAALYERLVADHPDNVDLKALQAAAATYQESLEALTALADKHPDNARAQLELGRAQLGIGEYRDAEKTLRSAIKLKAGPIAHVLSGDALLAQDKFTTAMKAYKAALDMESDYIPAHLRRSLCLHRQGKSDEALKLAEKLVGEDNYPNLVAGHWLIAIILADTGNSDGAMKAMDTVLKLDPGDYEASLAKGYLLLRAEKPAEAAVVFTKLAKDHESAESLFALGWAHEKASDLPALQDAQKKEHLAKAAEAYEKCSEFDPTVRPRDSLGFVNLLADKHGEAMTQFKRAADIDPKFASAKNNVGLAHDIADNRAQAKRRYEEVLAKIDKKNVRAMVMLALDLWIDGSAPKAIKLLDKALKIRPEDDLAWSFLGDIHYDSGKVDRAIKAYKQAVKINDKNFFAWFHMGIAYDEDKNKFEDAERCYEKAHKARLDPPHDLLMRLGEINDVDFLDRPDRALQYYQAYVDAGGPETWVPDRIEELKELLAGK